jgi:hypothetical protein
MDLAANDQAMAQARAEATAALRTIQQRATDPTAAATTNTDRAQAAHQQAIRDDIDRFLKRPDTTFKQVTPLPTPPGDPIGSRGSVR